MAKAVFPMDADKDDKHTIIYLTFDFLDFTKVRLYFGLSKILSNV